MNTHFDVSSRYELSSPLGYFPSSRAQFDVALAIVIHNKVFVSYVPLGNGTVVFLGDLLENIKSRACQSNYSVRSHESTQNTLRKYKTVTPILNAVYQVT